MKSRARAEQASVSADALRGAVAGAVATGVMTVVMTRVLPALLPRSAQLDEPMPRRVVRRGEEIAGESLSARAEDLMTTLAHYGYGSAAGAGYGIARPRVMHRRTGALAGALYGLGVWAMGYAGWLPLAGVRQGTVREPPPRWSNPLLSHLAFGVSLGLVERALAESGRQSRHSGQRPGAASATERRGDHQV